MRFSSRTSSATQPLTFNAVTLALQDYAANLVRGHRRAGQVPRFGIW